MWRINQYAIDNTYRQDYLRRCEKERLADIARQSNYVVRPLWSLAIERLRGWISSALHHAHRAADNNKPTLTAHHAHR